MCIELASITENTDDIKESSGFTTRKLSFASVRLFSLTLKGFKVQNCVQMCTEPALRSASVHILSSHI
jgi:hypothetical protein